MLRRSGEYDLSLTSSAINAEPGEHTPLLTNSQRSDEPRPINPRLLARFEEDVQLVSPDEWERQEENNEVFRNRVAELGQEQPSLSLNRRRVLAAIDLFINSMNMLAITSSALWIANGWPDSYEEVAERLKIIGPALCAGAFGLNAAAMRSEVAAKLNNLVLALTSGANLFTLVLDYSIQFALAGLDRSGARVNVTNALFFGAFVAPTGLLGLGDAGFNLFMSEEEQERRAQSSSRFRIFHSTLRTVLASGTLFALALMIADRFFDLDGASSEDDPHVMTKLMISIASIIGGIIHEVAAVYFSLSPQRYLDSLAQIVFMYQNLNHDSFEEMPEFLRVIYTMLWPTIALAATFTSIALVRPEVAQEQPEEEVNQENNDQPVVDEEAIEGVASLFDASENQEAPQASAQEESNAQSQDEDPECAIRALFNDDFNYSPEGARFKLFSHSTTSSAPVNDEDYSNGFSR